MHEFRMIFNWIHAVVTGVAIDYLFSGWDLMFPLERKGEVTWPTTWQMKMATWFARLTTLCGLICNNSHASGFDINSILPPLLIELTWIDSNIMWLFVCLDEWIEFVRESAFNQLIGDEQLWLVAGRKWRDDRKSSGGAPEVDLTFTTIGIQNNNNNNNNNKLI